MLLYEIDYLQHEKMPPTPSETLGQPLLDWLYASTTDHYLIVPFLPSQHWDLLSFSSLVPF
ncbi:hypothetical protein BDF20DRAFT_397456 [Mycotypha africana]|uniref:uncharacterized protein n=1 Tax=Mycotypha africana TaxID=64632 RepID=UPI0022FFF2AD|nr:uncharacterized protein BDF20DRAFT_397456 [Mycotypha africana]KAI8984580.1 hypothetical protein BDF20DRAFT_397456 [Mycotypha africana]